MNRIINSNDTNINWMWNDIIIWRYNKNMYNDNRRKIQKLSKNIKKY